MKIAFFDGYALDAGAGIALRDLIAGIDRGRFEPIALLPREGPLASMLREIDCPVEVIKPPAPLSEYGRRLSEAGAWRKLRATGALVRYSLTVGRWLRSHQVDLLHCNQTRAVFKAGPGGRLAGVPVTWNVRIRERLPRAVLRLCDECADLIIPLTHRDFAGLPDEQRLLSKSTVIRNAIDTQHFSPSRDAVSVRRRLGFGEGPLVLTAGVLTPRKGFDLVILAMEQVGNVHPDASLLIAGGEPGTGGGCRAQLEALVADHGLSGSVYLAGHRDDMPVLMAACDLFVLASHAEGDPAVVLEAMATARPVVVTAPAAAGVTDGVTGLIVPPADVDGLGAAMLRVLADRDRARQMGEAGRSVVEAEHDIRTMVRRYEAAWEGLLI
ncbi:MAG: glycosyltransferase family 4 protein [Armatimonadota bacterium]